MKPNPDKDDSAAIKVKGFANFNPAAAEAEGAPLAPPNPIEVLLRIFCADSMKRLEGRAGMAVPFAYKNNITKSSEKYYSVHLFHQILLGAIGGVACGVETGYISFDRLPKPNTPFPASWSQATAVTQATLRNGSVLWNTTKRAAIAGLMFDLVDKNIEEARGTRDWSNFAWAGFMSGVIFGLRGGTRGVCTCSLGFTFFGALAGFFANYNRGGQNEK